MKKNILSAIIVALAFLPAQLSAQQSRTQKIINAALKGWNIELRAGYNLGGTSPIPLPVEIREIKSYKPSMGFSVESDFTKFFDEKWGLLVGVKLENKNMETDARGNPQRGRHCERPMDWRRENVGAQRIPDVPGAGCI